jgi:RNA polymerase sigma-70 factor, ECF subfamily
VADEDTHPLSGFIAEARASWPELRGDTGEFAEFVERRLGDGDPHIGVASLRAGDLWLAYRCSVHDAAALRSFRDAMRPEIDAVMRDPSAASIERAEVEQQVLERLFTDTPRRCARIHDYNGRGPLGRWVYVVATRIRVDLQRKRSDFDESLRARDDMLLAEDDDQELDYFKRHYRAAFREAFSAAIAELGARERTLLRLHVVHGRSATGIAEVYRVHRATAKRWLADIRARLLAETRARLQQALAIDAAQLDSIMRLIGSRLDASVRAHLGESADSVPI